MFCMHCGTYIPEETNFCTNCGAPVENRPNYQQEAPQMQSFGNSLAPTSMICGICSIVCFISMSFALGILIGAITGVILGILGILFGLLTNFNKSTTKFAITRNLNPGDKVICVPTANGNKYFIVDKVVV